VDTVHAERMTKKPVRARVGLAAVTD